MIGSCLCGAVSFSVKGPVSNPSACHCGQCRKQSGHYWASAQVASALLETTGKVSWFRSSDNAQRGFCGSCGSFLYWKADHEDAVSFSLGAIDGATGLKLRKNIFVEDMGDYYSLPAVVAESG